MTIKLLAEIEILKNKLNASNEALRIACKRLSKSLSIDPPEMYAFDPKKQSLENWRTDCWVMHFQELAKEGK